MLILPHIEIQENFSRYCTNLICLVRDMIEGLIAGLPFHKDGSSYIEKLLTMRNTLFMGTTSKPYLCVKLSSIWCICRLFAGSNQGGGVALLCENEEVPSDDGRGFKCLAHSSLLW